MAPADAHTSQVIQELRSNALHTRDYYALLIGSVLLAIGGIFADSIPVLIASMIVAPLAAPIVTLGMGLVIRDWTLVWRTLGLFSVSCVLAVILAVGVTLLFNDIRVKDVYVTFTENLYLATAIALVAGAIAAYGAVRPKVATAITGVAIAVSLMPPLVATGVGMATGNAALAGGAGILFVLNVLGILTASVVVFALLRIGRLQRI